MNVFDTEYIENDLRNKGFNPGHDGYYYLVYLFKCNLDMKILSRYKRLTDIYCDIARRYNKSPHVIRLSIKYAIDSAYAYQRRHGLNTFEYYRLNGDNITIKEFVTQWRREQDEKRAFD